MPRAKRLPVVRRAPRAAWLPYREEAVWSAIPNPTLPPDPVDWDAPPRVARRQRAPKPISPRMGEGHVLFRILRNRWRAEQRYRVLMGGVASPVQHNQRPCQDMRWWPR